MKEGDREPGAGVPERVPECQRTAVDVDALGVETEQAIVCAANASLISTKPMSATSRPERSSSLRIAGTGAIAKRSGSTAAIAVPITRANGVTPSGMESSEARTRALAPSLTGDALPAVMSGASGS